MKRWAITSPYWHPENFSYYRLGSERTPSFMLNNDPVSVHGAKQKIYLESADYFVLKRCMHMKLWPR